MGAQMDEPDDKHERRLQRQSSQGELAPAGLVPGGLVRLDAILAPKGPIPVSKSTWWAGVSDGRFPRPIKLGPRITVWRTDDVLDLIEHGVD